MSEPKRYLTDSLIPSDDICPDAVGEVYAMVVRYEDYARLKAELIKQIEEASNARLKVAEVVKEAMNLAMLYKADVQRLTKENETRQRDMNLMFQEIKEGREAYQRLHYLYLTAKEGKQS